jgi:DNA-binding Lrp family transcriptional regulator
MDEIDRQIINQLQHGLVVCERPYQSAAEALGISEAELCDRLQHLLDEGYLSRFGPMYHAEKMGGALTLAAVSVPSEQLETVAEIINTFPEVAHNYAREHRLNIWFVIATERPEQVADVIGKIEQQTGYPVYNLPKIKEYFVGLKLDV